MREFFYEVTCRPSIMGQETLYKIHHKLERYGMVSLVQREDKSYRRVLSVDLNRHSSSTDVENAIRNAGLEVRVVEPDEFR